MLYQTFSKTIIYTVYPQNVSFVKFTTKVVEKVQNYQQVQCMYPTQGLKTEELLYHGH